MLPAYDRIVLGHKERTTDICNKTDAMRKEPNVTVYKVRFHFCDVLEQAKPIQSDKEHFRGLLGLKVGGKLKEARRTVFGLGELFCVFT